MIEFWKIIITVVVADVIGQTIKLFTHRSKTGNFNFNILLSDGGMPSGHSATVAALATTVYYYTGLSILFAVSLFFTIIVLRDATGVRRSAGRQAEVLNRLIQEEGWKIKRLKELLGHTPMQMLAGVVLGIIIATIFNFWIF